ncbi:MAG TPA: hypothetical protein VI168_00450 [Croceibacterium sp.]
MSRRRARSLLPRRLTALAPARLKWVRALWFFALAFAVVFDIAGTVFALRETYRIEPQFQRLALESQTELDASVTVSTLEGLTGGPPVPALSRIAAIDGKPVARDLPSWELAERLRAEDGTIVALTIVAPDGRAATHRIEASPRYRAQLGDSGPVSRDTRLAIRLGLSLLTCVTLIACAVLLFLRRPRDPVALLFSFAFLMFAATIDPPLRLWTAIGLGHAFDVYLTLGWGLLVIGMAAFPDGKFTPPPVRWVLVAAPLIAVPLVFDELPVLIGTVLAFVLPLFLLACHVIKYRRFEPGIERQQVKWAAFGFGSGLTLLTAALTLFALTDTPTGPPVLASLAFLALFNLGFMAMALGLLVSLIRFRLWEADAVIGRSAISAGVTLLVGILWTLSMDMVKIGVEAVLGEENTTVATVVGGIIAAGVFAPTQALAMRWAKRRLEGDESRIERLIGRLAVWRTTETPGEIAVRALSALHAAVHCNAAAVLIDGPRGLALLASRDVEQADALSAPGYEPAKDARFAMRLPLEDEDGPLGLLLVGPRSDLNRYNAAQLRGLGELTEPLAEALRAAMKREQHAETVHLKLGSVEERLARLEQSGPRLRPT